MSTLEAASEAIEAALVAAVCEVMDRADVVADTDIFTAYGVQSLTALRVILAAQERDVTLSIADMYQHRTLRALARHVAATPAEPEI